MSQCPIKIDEGRQNKHVLGHPNYKRGRSILRVPAEELLPFALTGQPLGSFPRGTPGFRERIDFGRYIGEHVSKDGKTATPSTKGIIHYAKSGLHIVPANA